MFKLLIWIGWLLFLVLLCVVLSRRVLLTPQFCFVGCFLPQALFALYFVERWEIDFSFETMVVLMGGTGLFFAFSAAITVFAQSYRAYVFRNYDLAERDVGRGQQKFYQEIRIERWKLIFLLVVQVAVLVLVVYYIMYNYPGSDLFAKIAMINNANKFGAVDERILLPPMVRWPRTFCMYSCYITAYILIHSKVLKYKQYNKLLAANILISLVTMLTAGGRMPLVIFIVACAVETYIVWGKANHWRARIRLKAVFMVILIAFIIIFTFQRAAALVGRENDTDVVAYLGGYIVAPIKNLDTYVREGRFGLGSDISKCQTVRNLVDFIGRKFGIPSWAHQGDLPFRWFHGYTLGNVHTCFYPYLYDGGFPSLVFYVLFQVVFFQIAFQKAVYGKQKRYINIHIIFYSLAVVTLAFSFFGDSFFETVISMNMIQRLVSWWLLSFFFERVRFSKAVNTMISNAEA